MSARPACSVIVPVYARRHDLARLLGKLGEQTGAPEFEVLVVENGRRLNYRWLRQREWPFPVRYEYVADGAQAKARNVGAALAAAPRLLFLDSDIDPGPNTVAALGNGERPGVVMADVVFPARTKVSLATHLYDVPAYFRTTYRARARTGLSFRDFVSCSFTMSREEFLALGGFDEGFTHYGYEDVEFAWRAEKAGIPFHLGGAKVAHHKQLGPTAVHARAQQLGRSAVHFVRRHPDLEDTLPLGVRDTLDGVLAFPPVFDIDRLLREAAWIERQLTMLRRGPSLGRARGLIARGREVYHEITRFGRYQGISTELARLDTRTTTQERGGHGTQLLPLPAAR
ncbi:galactosyltransferase-related protein [Crossiella sp. CA-258035]|uniref:glycosyltransferase family 2 protein n=1 Tax=Crossiella sp. CA-258035 TaxID=2981138 RepID=UPI0024BBF03E|nr:galactosyltransferase-related protein [Crossiella sp. CA-258035]WHT16220.1 galactosyltransferase-related protein [Crossiella sp. CA-258035]